jgi:hypothetical protein
MGRVTWKDAQLVFPSEVAACDGTVMAAMFFAESSSADPNVDDFTGIR